MTTKTDWAKTPEELDEAIEIVKQMTELVKSSRGDAIKTEMCGHCFKSGVLHKEIFKTSDDDWVEYICRDCDEQRIIELTEEYENGDCGCSKTQANCGHPICPGYWT